MFNFHNTEFRNTESSHFTASVCLPCFDFWLFFTFYFHILSSWSKLREKRNGIWHKILWLFFMAFMTFMSTFGVSLLLITFMTGRHPVWNAANMAENRCSIIQRELIHTVLTSSFAMGSGWKERGGYARAWKPNCLISKKRLAWLKIMAAQLIQTIFTTKFVKEVEIDSSITATIFQKGSQETKLIMITSTPHFRIERRGLRKYV